MGCAKHRLRRQSSGESLLEHHLKRMACYPFRRRMLVGLCPEELPPGWCAVSDPPEFSGHGPLAGLLAALSGSKADWVAVLAVDYPNFPPQQFFRSAGEAKAQDWLIFTDHDGREQWLCSLMRPHLATLVAEALEEGHRSVKSLFSRTKSQALSLPGETARAAFLNLNAPSDLVEWKLP